MDVKQMLATELQNQLSQNPAFQAIKIESEMMENPQDASLGDIALPCFPFAKILKKSPAIIADLLKDTLSLPAFIEKADAVNGYLNFYLDKNSYAKSVVGGILNNRPCFEPKNQTVIVEYSSPNIAKPFHIGHLCSTVIGDALSRINTALGYHVVRINYLGDYGTQFGKLIAAYKRWGNEAALQETPFDELLRIYVKFHEQAEQDPSLIDEGRKYFKRLEDKCPEEIALWQRFKDVSLEKFSKLYTRLGAEFDSFDGESFYSDKMQPVIKQLKEKNLLVESEGAQVVDLSDQNMPPCIILKADGATIYATRDIAAAIYRKNKYDFVKMLYVVGLPQALHFQQFFTVLGKMDYPWHKDCKHVGFAHVKFSEGKMSTRTGNVILLDDVLDESVRRAKGKISQEYIEADKIDETAEIIGIGALKYAFLKSGRERDITFSWEETLDFNGNSGPYVQYSYARAMSILNKCGSASDDCYSVTSAEEFELVKALDGYKDAVIDAAQRNEPSVITRYVYNLSKLFNRFYNTCDVIGSPYQQSRVNLVAAAASVIQKSLALLGIKTPEKM